MKKAIFLILSLFLWLGPVHAQGKKKRAPKEKQITAEEAQEKAIEQKRAVEAENMAKYQKGVDQHQELQDKQTQKRMKKNLKRSQKQSWGKQVPWYKRWFRREHI